MNPNEYFKDDPEKKWKIFCYRFIGRSRRLDSLKKLKCPELMLEKEKELIQTAYDEMREGCLSDPDYLARWEHKGMEKNNENS